MSRHLRVIAAALLILASASLAPGCSKSSKSTNPYGGGGSTPELSSGDLSNTSVYAHRFFNSGTFNYHCSKHPSMKGTVNVSLSAPASDSLASVSITNFAFGLATVTIPIGGKVTWTNNSGGTTHTVTSD